MERGVRGGELKRDEIDGGRVDGVFKDGGECKIKVDKLGERGEEREEQSCPRADQLRATDGEASPDRYRANQRPDWTTGTTKTERDLRPSTHTRRRSTLFAPPPCPWSRLSCVATRPALRSLRRKSVGTSCGNATAAVVSLRSTEEFLIFDGAVLQVEGCAVSPLKRSSSRLRRRSSAS